MSKCLEAPEISYKCFGAVITASKRRPYSPSELGLLWRMGSEGRSEDEIEESKGRIRGRAVEFTR